MNKYKIRAFWCEIISWTARTFNIVIIISRQYFKTKLIKENNMRKVIRCSRCGDSPSYYNYNEENICVVCENNKFTHKLERI